MDPSSPRSPAGHSPIGPAVDTPSKGASEPDSPLPPALRRPPSESAGPSTPLRQQSIATGSRSDVKSSPARFSSPSLSSSSSERTTPFSPSTDSDGETPPSSSLSEDRLYDDLQGALQQPIDPSKPVFSQVARLGALHRQYLQADDEASPTYSAWQHALAVNELLPGLLKAGSQLLGPKFTGPPSRHDLGAMLAQASASLDLDPRAPLPNGAATAHRLAQSWAPASTSSSSASSQQPQVNLGRIHYLLDRIADRSDEPLRREASGPQILRSLDALAEEIRLLLANTSSPCPEQLHAGLTRLGARVEAERGFVEQAEAFVQAHDTANLNFEDITAYMRHGVSHEQLQFLLFQQSVHVAFRASFERGSPIEVPQEVAHSYEGLWQRLAATMGISSPGADGTTTPKEKM